MHQIDLSESEHRALEILEASGGGLLVTNIQERNSKDDFGNIIPGITIYKKLELKGLVVITEEEADLNGFKFTSYVYLADN